MPGSCLPFTQPGWIARIEDSSNSCRAAVASLSSRVDSLVRVLD